MFSYVLVDHKTFAAMTADEQLEEIGRMEKSTADILKHMRAVQRLTKASEDAAKPATKTKADA